MLPPVSYTHLNKKTHNSSPFCYVNLIGPVPKVIFDLNEEWNKIQGVSGSSMVTGVTVVRKEFLEAVSYTHLDVYKRQAHRCNKG